MGHTYTNLLTHIIFSTKDRLPYLRTERQRDVLTYIDGIVRELKGSAITLMESPITSTCWFNCRLPCLSQKRWRS
jgi:hypothetical protein